MPQDLPLYALLLAQAEALLRHGAETRPSHLGAPESLGSGPGPERPAMPGDAFTNYKFGIDALLVESRRQPGSVPEGDKRYLYLLREACGRCDAGDAERWFRSLSEASREALGPPPVATRGEKRPRV